MAAKMDFGEVLEFLEPCQLADVERWEAAGWRVCSIQWAGPEMQRGRVVVVLKSVDEKGVIKRHYSYPWGVIMKRECKRKGVPVDQAS